MSCFREGISLAENTMAIKVVLIASLGKLYSETGDCTSFEKLLKEFREISDNRSQAVLQGAVYIWYNYGVTLDNAYQWEEAANAYAQAAELAAQYAPHMTGLALHNLGGVQLALGKLAQAAMTMAQAEELLSEEEVGHKKWSRRAEYFLIAGDLVSAQEAVTTALVHPSCDDMTRADVYFTWALTLEALGRPTHAQEKALLALDFAVKAVHYPGIHKVNQFLQRVGPKRPVYP